MVPIDVSSGTVAHAHTFHSTQDVVARHRKFPLHYYYNMRVIPGVLLVLLLTALACPPRARYVPYRMPRITLRWSFTCVFQRYLSCRVLDYEVRQLRARVHSLENML
jgi:hypothetical protein